MLSHERALPIRWFLLEERTDVSTLGNLQFIGRETTGEPELASQYTLQMVLKMKVISQGQIALTLENES